MGEAHAMLLGNKWGLFSGSVHRPLCITSSNFNPWKQLDRMLKTIGKHQALL